LSYQGSSFAYFSDCHQQDLLPGILRKTLGEAQILDGVDEGRRACTSAELRDVGWEAETV
jgi:hypothetical protein